ncbi:hypothetical protein VTP01DRAFT_9351 [Rhizomucor pusillus]|uniref:uncharacterized protein n=1 Tax=Rhizomucor pusillus TaxID=4840 RepID=UPI0037447F2C
MFEHDDMINAPRLSLERDNQISLLGTCQCIYLLQCTYLTKTPFNDRLSKKTEKEVRWAIAAYLAQTKVEKWQTTAVIGHA